MPHEVRIYRPDESGTLQLVEVVAPKDLSYADDPGQPDPTQGGLRMNGGPGRRKKINRILDEFDSLEELNS